MQDFLGDGKHTAAENHGGVKIPTPYYRIFTFNLLMHICCWRLDSTELINMSLTQFLIKLLTYQHRLARGRIVKQ